MEHLSSGKRIEAIGKFQSWSLRLVLFVGIVAVNGVILEGCRENSSSASPRSVLTSGFQGNYIVFYDRPFQKSPCSQEQHFPNTGSCSIEAKSDDRGRVYLTGEECVWWPSVSKTISGQFDSKGTFLAFSGISCIICCCEFSISGRFYSDRTLTGEAYVNFSHNEDCAWD